MNDTLLTPTLPELNATDFHAFGALRRAARDQSPEALRTVAQQFEAMFLKMILQGMRDGKLAEDVLGGDQDDVYRDLHDQQMAQHLTRDRELGIADLLVRQLAPVQRRVDGASPAPSDASAVVRPSPVSAYERSVPRPIAVDVHG